MYHCFGLVLMVDHACNLRCRYCYNGKKFSRPMPEAFGRKAIDRALASQGSGGTLELGFFGGEPLLQPGLIRALLEYAQDRSEQSGVPLSVSITTNGTVTTPAAWSLMTDPRVDLAVSHDGLPVVHDRHRRSPDGRGSSARVLVTISRLLDAGKDPRVVLVVRPDTVEYLPDGLAFLQGVGVKHLEPSLDLWTPWSHQDVTRLKRAVRRAARIWREGLPDCSISWFDEKAGLIIGIPMAMTARCSFGAGEVAVTPSGSLYPCERLIGEDTPDNPMRLPGHVLKGDDFLSLGSAPCRNHAACAQCSIATFCNTTCRCCNYTRTGDVSTPDGLLCSLNRTVFLETTKVLDELSSPRSSRTSARLSGGLTPVSPVELIEGERITEYQGEMRGTG